MIKVSGLTKNYKALKALDNVTLNIGKGEFYGLLGPNGAGKTTMINILSAVLKPDTGSVRINNLDIIHDAKKYKFSIGVVPQEVALYEELSAFDNLMFWGGLYRIEKHELKKRIERTIKLLGLSDRIHDRIRTYSGGMKRRVNMAAALLHDPEVLFLDEPTVGIDPQSRNLIFDVLTDMHHKGMTIVYTTHYMEEAEKLCERIGIIDNGRIIAEGNLDELKKINDGQDMLTISTNLLEEKDIVRIKDMLGNSVIIMDNCVSIRFQNTPDGLQELIRQWTRLRLPIHRLSLKEVSLETIFLNLTGRSLRD
jgi:ABC-2 type transport system ATP-binding protein